MAVSSADRALAASALIAVAIGVLGNAYLALGTRTPAAFSALGLLWPMAAAAGLAAIVAMALSELRRTSRLATGGGAVLALPFLLALGALSALPPAARDELTHHLAVPALYLRSGGIVEIPFADQSYYPMLLEMFYTPLLAWLPDNSPKFLHLLFGAAAAAVVGLGAARGGGPAAGVAALLMVLLTPVVLALACTAYVDLGLVFYTAVAVVALQRWFAGGERLWFVVSALAAGFAAATKYNGLIVLALMALWTAWHPRRRPAHRLAAAAAYLLIGLIPLAPWLLKNLSQTGNPTYPLFHGVFGGRPLPPRPSVDVFTRRRLIHGESWLEIAAVPLRIFLTGREGAPASFDGVYNPILLLGIAAAFTRRATREQRVLLGFAAAYFFLAFVQTDMRARYVLPILPPLALVAAPALVDLARSRPRIAGVVTALGVAFSAAHLADTWRRADPLAYLSGREDRQRYVARFAPELPVVEYANAKLPAGAHLYLAFLGNRSYYCRRSFAYDTYYSGSTLLRHIEAAADADSLRASLRAEGYSHMIAADELLGRYLNDNLAGAALERWRVFAGAHLARLTSANGFSLYEIT